MSTAAGHVFLKCSAGMTEAFGDGTGCTRLHGFKILPRYPEAAAHP